jgi:hypothetical protein
VFIGRLWKRYSSVGKFDEYVDDQNSEVSIKSYIEDHHNQISLPWAQPRASYSKML